MGIYAQIVKGNRVNLIVVDNDNIADELRAAGLSVNNINGVDPPPRTGWEYSAGSYLSQLRTFARIVNDAVSQVQELRQAAADGQMNGGAVLIDITDMTPQPEVGWSYIDGVFSAP